VFWDVVLRHEMGCFMPETIKKSGKIWEKISTGPFGAKHSVPAPLD